MGVSEYLQDINVKYGVTAIEEDTLVKNPTVGVKYHLYWASNRGMVWILHNIQGDRVHLKTPKTGKSLYAWTKDLREINKNILVNARKRVESYKNQ